METVLGFRHSVVLVASGDESVLTVAASRGYDGGWTGAEIPLGQGVLGVAARRRRIVRMGNVGDAAGLSGRRARPARRQWGKPRLSRLWKCRGSPMRRAS